MRQGSRRTPGRFGTKGPSRTDLGRYVHKGKSLDETDVHHHRDRFRPIAHGANLSHMGSTDPLTKECKCMPGRVILPAQAPSCWASESVKFATRRPTYGQWSAGSPGSRIHPLPSHSARRR